MATLTWEVDNMRANAHLESAGFSDAGLAPGEVDRESTVGAGSQCALERGDLNTLVAGLSEDDFARPTRCAGWTVAEQLETFAVHRPSPGR